MSDYELTDNAKRTLLRLSMLLYAAALFLPTGAGLGLLCLLMGWFEVFSSPKDGLAWLANPVLFVTWGLITARRRGAARAVSLVALVLGGSWILQHKAITSEAGFTEWVPLKVGYWIWLVSLMLAAFSAFFGVRDRAETAI
jgi:hypothetical protein